MSPACDTNLEQVDVEVGDPIPMQVQVSGKTDGCIKGVVTL